MAGDFINYVQEIRGTQEIGQTALPEDADGIYHDIVRKTTEDDGVTERLGEGLYGSMKIMADSVSTVNENIDDITLIGDHIDGTLDTAILDIANELNAKDLAGVEYTTDVYSRIVKLAEAVNIAAVATLGESANITLMQSLSDDKITLDSIYADKSTLDSIFADKTILNSIFADKTILNSIYADKSTLDSIFADKITLDSLFTDKATLDRLHTSIDNIDTVTVSILNIDTVADNVVGVNAVGDSIASVNIIADNIPELEYFADIYQGPKAVNPVLRNDGSTLVAGDMYFNTTDNRIYTYTDPSWVVAPVNISDIVINNVIGTPTDINTFEDVYNHMHSSGVSDGGVLTDNLDGTVDIGEAQATLRATGGTGHTTLYSVVVPALTGITLVDNSMNIVYAEYNNGTPQFNVTTTQSEINLLDKVPLYMIVREGTSLYYIDGREQHVDHVGRALLKTVSTEKFVRKGDSGAVVGDAGTLHLNCTAGVFYFQYSELALPSLDTSGIDTFMYAYRDGIGGWINSLESILSTTNFDDGSGILATVANNKYVNQWIYGVLGSTSHYMVIYGQAEYSNVAGAQAESPIGVLPPMIQGVGTLLGRAITQQGTTEIVLVETIFDTTFSSSTATDHNNLAGIQGGDVNDYFHLTSAEVSRLANIVPGTNVAELVSGTVPVAQLPSYVDDVLEYADLASLPATGEVGKIYVTLDTNFMYRWSGSAYIDITGKVDSVNDQTGIVVLGQDDVLDGITYKQYSVTEQTKLAGIEEVATADQTDTEIKTAYENNADTNAYTDLEKSTLTNLTSADKLLAAMNITDMQYSNGDLVAIVYEGVGNSEGLTYGIDGLSNIAHTVDSALSGNTVLTYVSGDLDTVTFTAV